MPRSTDFGEHVAIIGTTAVVGGGGGGSSGPNVTAYADLATFLAAGQVLEEEDCIDLVAEGVRLTYNGGTLGLSSGLEGEVLVVADQAALEVITDALALEGILPVTNFLALLSSGAVTGGGSFRQLIGEGLDGADVYDQIVKGNIIVHEGADLMDSSGVVICAPGDRFTMSVDITAWIATRAYVSATVGWSPGSGTAEDHGWECGVITNTGAFSLAQRLITYGGAALGFTKLAAGISCVDSVNTNRRRIAEIDDGVAAANMGTGAIGTPLSASIELATTSSNLTGKAWSHSLDDYLPGSFSLGTQTRLFFQAAVRAGSDGGTQTFSIESFVGSAS